jgi:hypothetical protein
MFAIILFPAFELPFINFDSLSEAKTFEAPVRLKFDADIYTLYDL